MSKLTLLAAAAAGYVLGARAGRERYEEIATQARKVARNPKVRSATTSARDAATQQASAAVDVAKDKLGDAVQAGTDKLHSQTSPDGAPNG